MWRSHEIKKLRPKVIATFHCLSVVEGTVYQVIDTS